MALNRFLRGAGRLAGAASPFVSMVPGVGTLAGVGLGMAGAYAARRAMRGRGGGGPGDEESLYRNRFEAALGSDGAGMEDRYLADMESFDPTAGFAEQTQAELAAQDENFARTYGDRMGQMVGAGRLPTRSGYGVQDAQDLVLQGQRERAAIQARNAAAANEARARHLYARGAAATGTRNRYFDAVGGRFNTLESQRLSDEAERRRGRAGLLGGILGAGAQLGSAYLASRGARVPRPPSRALPLAK
jgi:hypothetical protein